MSSVRVRQVRNALIGAVLITVGEGLTWLLLRSQGNDLGGDQAHYLIASRAVSHGSVHPLPQYARDFATHFIYRWPPGAALTNHAIVQTYPGPHGSVFAHGLGLPILLAPFMAIGSVPLALLGMFAITAFGMAFVHQRASLLADLSLRAEVVFALALAGPAMWLASTQVYPDFMSGVFLAVALVEIGWIERRSYISGVNAVAIVISLIVEPWLQVKNLGPALCCVVALGYLWRRVPTQRRLLLSMAVLVLVGWVVLAVYNQYYFSNLLGLPQPDPTFDLTSLSRIVALVFDRHQGLLVQMPTVLLGLVGIWLCRRRVPLTAGVSFVAALLIILINGTYTSGVPFGGTDLAGRFQWTALPVLLLWSAFTIGALDRHRRRLYGLAGVIALLWLAQGIPILMGDHVYVNSMIAPFAPWDPTLYPGWWPFIGQWLPSLLPPGLHLASTWTHLLAELLGVFAVIGLIGLLARNQKIDRRALVSIPLALVIAAVIVLAVGPTRTQPTTSLSWSGAEVGGAPWSATQQPITTAPIELADVGPGTYRLTIHYAALLSTGLSSATLMATPTQHVVVAGWFTPHHPTDAALLQVTAPPVVAGTGLLRHDAVHKGSGHQGTLTVHVTHNSTISLYVTLQPHSLVSASTLTLSKVSR
ncbi:MAG TPA: hypothetical protein VGG38_13375 [Acidimicrobiales bacterium]|jgi:hypothetical protein